MIIHRIKYHTEKGAVLIISLIILLTMTLIGLVAMQNTSLEEKMAGNMRDQDLAFQAAESSLRDAEDWITSQAYEPTANTSGSHGVWTLNSASTTVPWWEDSNAWASNAITITNDIPDIKTQPRHLIEEAKFVGDGQLNVGLQQDVSGSMYYRVTSMGTGGTDQARVLLQSSFAKRY